MTSTPSNTNLIMLKNKMFSKPCFHGIERENTKHCGIEYIFSKIIERSLSHVNPDFEISYRKLGPNKKGNLFKMMQDWSSKELINLWPSTS